MNDLISRRDAIRIAEQGQVQGFEWQFKKLCKLPSAQSERAIKDCRNCKYGKYNDHWDLYFCYYSGDCNDGDKWEPSAQLEQRYTEEEKKESCSACGSLENGDTLYSSCDWDGGIGFDYIRDIKYCPVCGRKL